MNAIQIHSELQTADGNETELVGAQAQEGIRSALESARAPATNRVYDSAWRGWVAWATERGYVVLPATAGPVAAFLVERAKAGASKAALNLSRAAIAFKHLSVGADNPMALEGVAQVLKGLRRQDVRPAAQARPLTAMAMAAIAATACQPRKGRGGAMERPATATARGNKDVALCRVARDGMLRRSEISALTWQDVDFQEDGTARLTIRRSKTDQAGEGATLYLSRQTTAAVKLIEPIDVDATRPVFGLTGAQIARRIASAAVAAGLGEGFNGHSCRVGMAQDLAAAGVELPALMTAGRWQSERMPARYTQNQSAARGAIARYYGE